MRSAWKKIKELLAGSLLLAVLPAIVAKTSSAPNLSATHEKGHSEIDFDGLLKEVIKLSQKKEYQKAIDLLLTSVDKRPNDNLLKTLLMQSFDFFLSDEIKRGQEQIKNGNGNVEDYLGVAGAFELLGDNFRAMEILLSGIAKKQSAKLWMRIAVLEEKADRKMEALDVFREVIRFDHRNSLAHHNAAFILVQTTDSHKKGLKEAERLVRQAIKLDPQNAEYIDTLAEIYFKKGNSEAAQKLMKKAIKLAPGDEHFRSRLQGFKNAPSISSSRNSH